MFRQKGLTPACRPLGVVLALTGLLVLITEIPWQMAKIILGVALLATGGYLLRQGR